MDEGLKVPGGLSEFELSSIIEEIRRRDRIAKAEEAASASLFNRVKDLEDRIGRAEEEIALLRRKSRMADVYPGIGWPYPGV